MSSFVEAFLVTFLGDTTNLEDSTKKAKKSTKELNKETETSDVIYKKLTGTVKSLVKEYGGLIAAYASVRALYSGVTDAIQYADNLGKISSALNINVEDLSVWSNAITSIGGNAEAFQGTLASLSDTLSQFSNKAGSDGAMVLRQMGINLADVAGKARPVLDILPEIATAFERLNSQQSTQLGKRLGLDAGTIALLQRGRTAVDEVLARQKALGVVTKADTEASRKFNEQWADTAAVFRSVFVSVSGSVLPAFTAVLHGIEKIGTFFKKHSGLITGLMIALGASILVFVVPPLLSAAAAALVLYAPFLLIGAAVAALSALFALLYEDLMVFSNGGESFVGSLMKDFPALGEVLHDVWDILKDIGSIFQDLWSIAKPILGFLGKTFKAVFSDVWSVAKPILSAILSIIKGIISAVKFFTGAVKSVKGAVDSVFGEDEKSKNETTEEKTKRLLGGGQNALNFANKNPISSQTSNSISSSSGNQSSTNSVNTGNITINTQATDSEGIAKAFKGGVEEQFKQVFSSYSDGVRA